jgi:hypothetical protein
MICKRISDNMYFNYRFINDAVVQIDNPNYPIERANVYYKDWLDNYIIVNKWDYIKLHDNIYKTY